MTNLISNKLTYYSLQTIIKVSTTSILDVRLLLSWLNSNYLLICDKNLILPIDLELIINWLCIELFDLILIQDTLLDFFKVPGDKEFASWCHNWSLFSIGAKVVELSYFEVDVIDLVLGNISSLDRKFHWVWFLFTHSLIETSLLGCAHCWNNEKIGLSCCENPLPISRDF